VGSVALDEESLALVEEAGYKAENDQVAASCSATLLRNQKVAAALKARQAQAIQASDLTPERIMRELARIGLLDIRRLYDENGDIRPLHTLGDDEAAAISSIESTTSRSLEPGSSENPDDQKTIERTLKKLKVHDKLSALTLAMRHHGMLNDTLKVSGSVETAVRYVANMPARGSSEEA
jgi:phage terminase small subunit